MGVVYGPVPSRRLGRSLGVDPIPLKTCNYNCVYCQLGRTTPLTNERRDFFPPEAILAEVEAALKDHQPDSIDYITFVGQGEPLLCASLGRLIAAVKALTDIPVALITNGSLVFRDEVRQEMMPADVVMPTLDAADQTTFRRINRPWPRLRIADIIEGLVAFRSEFSGQLWVEVMLVRGVNDSEEVLLPLAAALERIGPDQVHLNIPIRPPAESWVGPPDEEGLIRAMAILGQVAPITTPEQGDFELGEGDSAADAVIEIIRRHPMEESTLVATLERFVPGRVQAVLQELEAGGGARRRIYRGQAFWQFSGDRRVDALRDCR